MRPIVQMREIYCRDCRCKSLVNPQHSTNCLRCGRSPYRNGPVLEGRPVIKQHAECPDCGILHPGRNVGAPRCGRCNQRRRQIVSHPAFIMAWGSDSYDSDENSDPWGGISDSDFDSFGSDNEDQFLVHSFRQMSLAQPLNPTVISNLRKITADQTMCGNECTICIEQFKVGDSVVALKCKHFYHHSCILTWFHSNDSCPLCRKIVN